MNWIFGLNVWNRFALCLRDSYIQLYGSAYNSVQRLFSCIEKTVVRLFSIKHPQGIVKLILAHLLSLRKFIVHKTAFISFIKWQKWLLLMKTRAKLFFLESKRSATHRGREFASQFYGNFCILDPPVVL